MSNLIPHAENVDACLCFLCQCRRHNQGRTPLSRAPVVDLDADEPEESPSELTRIYELVDGTDVHRLIDRGDGRIEVRRLVVGATTEEYIVTVPRPVLKRLVEAWLLDA